jgi:oligopeptide transport system substrate-binding protein
MKKFSIFCTVVFLILSLVSCSSKTDEKKSIMKTAFAIDPPTIDPRKNTDVFSSFLQKMLFEGLTRLEEEGKVAMGLAEKIDVSQDGLTYRFHLRDAHWTDGHPITAHDFEYTWKQVLDSSFGAPCAFLFYPIRNAPEVLKQEVSSDQLGIKAIDAKTFEVTLSHPTPYFLSLISFCPFFPIPKHIDEINPQWDRADHFSKAFVSNGPYRFVEWNRNNSILVEKNPAYWNRNNVSLEGIKILIIPDEKTVLRMFERGELDLVNSITTPLSTNELIHLKKEKKLDILPLSATSFFSFNLSHPLLNHLLVRKALSLAIDRRAIVQNITQMDEEPASRYIPSTLARNKQLSLMEPYNPALAKELLTQGIAELKQQGVQVDSLLETLVFSYENKELPRLLAQTLQQQWKDVLGLNIALQEHDFKTHIGNLERRQYTMGLYAWWVHYLDPSSILDRFKLTASLKNYPGFNHPTYVSLLNEAQETNDPDKRLRIMETAESIIVDAMPLSPLFHLNQVLLKSDRFAHVTASPLGDVLFPKAILHREEKR